jgi:hypothetical protein
MNVDWVTAAYALMVNALRDDAFGVDQVIADPERWTASGKGWRAWRMEECEFEPVKEGNEEEIMVLGRSGDRLYYILPDRGRLYEIEASAHAAETLLKMRPMKYWAQRYPMDNVCLGTA